MEYYCKLKFFELLWKVRAKIKAKSVVKLQKVWKGKITRSKSYLKALEIETHPRMYFVNTSVFKELLSSLEPKEREEYTVEQLEACIYHQEDEHNKGHDQYL